MPFLRLKSGNFSEYIFRKCDSLSAKLAELQTKGAASAVTFSPSLVDDSRMQIDLAIDSLPPMPLISDPGPRMHPKTPFLVDELDVTAWANEV